MLLSGCPLGIQPLFEPFGSLGSPNPHAYLHVLVKRLPVPLPEEAEGDALARQAALEVLLGLAPLGQQKPPVVKRGGLAVSIPALQGPGRVAAGSRVMH